MKLIGLINIAAYAYAYAYAYIYASTGLSIFAFMLRQACHKLLQMVRHYLSITMLVSLTWELSVVYGFLTRINQ